MDKDKLLQTIRLICDEKRISFDSVMETIEAALAAAYRKDFGDKMQNIKVNFDIESGDMEVYDVKTVVENLPEEMFDTDGKLLPTSFHVQEDEFGERADRYAKPLIEEENLPKFNPKTQIQIKDAKLTDSLLEVGAELRVRLETHSDFGRMAAQTAKQVIIQKLREAERSLQFEEFKGREGELLVGIIHRREGNRVLVDLGNNITGVIPMEEQIRSERYNLGDRVRVIVLSVEQSVRGPVIVLSRTSDKYIERLFEMEIPEIASGVVVIKAIAREPGSRSKVAVFTDDDGIDPIGACVGQRGARIQTIIHELGNEKVDIIQWSEDIRHFLTHAISPAKAQGIDIKEAEKSAVIYVLPAELSLAIGKAGQNVRLAVKLTGWNINIREANNGLSVVDSAEAVSSAESSDAKPQDPEAKVASEEV